MKITLLTGKTFDLQKAFNLPLKVRSSLKIARLSLRIDTKKRQVILNMPLLCSKKRAYAFVESHLDWIEAHLLKIPVAREFKNNETILLFGQKVTISHIPNSLSSPKLNDNVLEVGGDEVFLHRRVKDYIIKQAKTEFFNRSQQLADKLGCKVNHVTIKDTASRWGSCSTLNNINYNWRIALAPDYVIDYLMAHEVAHLKHRNHSADFWQCVKELCPAYEQGQTWLKKFGKNLYLYS